jgi:hypothetical protein
LAGSAHAHHHHGPARYTDGADRWHSSYDDQQVVGSRTLKREGKWASDRSPTEMGGLVVTGVTHTGHN